MTSTPGRVKPLWPYFFKALFVPLAGAIAQIVITSFFASLSFLILLLFLLLFILILGVVDYWHENENWPSLRDALAYVWTKWNRYVLYAFAFILAALLTAWWILPTSVTITHPPSGSLQQGVIVVEGTVRRLPENEQIWILVQPHATDKLYPQTGPALIQRDGGWSALIQGQVNWSNTNVRLGGGTGFDIIVALTTQDAGQQLQRDSEIEVLPDGAIGYDRVAVTKAQ